MSCFRTCRIHAVLLSLVFCWHATVTHTAPSDIARICDSAAEHVARESGVPIDVLRAISLTETGRKTKHGFLPWPWTVNMEGIGKWFDDYSAAQDYVDRHFARGARSFDVGCFQINYKWHGHAFDSIEDMFDPITNARYAASFLQELYSEFGDWSKAAGAYHSRTPKYANRYSARFDRIRDRLPPSEVVTVASVDPDPLNTEQKPRKQPNRFPLFQRTGVSGRGSLVPLGSAGMPLIDVGASQPLLVQR